MAITPVFTADTRGRRVLGNRHVVTGSFTTSGTWVNGTDIAITPSTVGLLQAVEVLEVSAGGFVWEFVPNTSGGGRLIAKGLGTVALDTGASAAGSSHNHAFTGTAQAPALKVEEAVTVTTNVGTLAHVPLYIVAIEVTAGSTTGAFKVIPTGETPLTTQCAVTFTNGTLTFLGSDAVTACRVTYIPKRGSGYLSSVTVDENVTAAAAKANLAARAGLVQYVWDDTDGILNVPEPPGEAPTATHNCVLDINDSGNSSLDAHADDEANTLKVTYVPYAQLPPGCFVDDTDITLNSEVWNFTGDPTVNGYHKTVVPGFGVNLVGEATATNQVAIWTGPSGTAANNVAVWNPARNAITTNQDTAMTTTAISWMVLDVEQLTPTTPAGTNAAEATHTHAFGTLGDTSTGGPSLEVTNGATVTISSGGRFMAIGY